MPANSVAQQRLFGLAEHDPEKLYAKNQGLQSMPKSTLHDFAATPTKGLPMHAPAVTKSPRVAGPKMPSVGRRKYYGEKI